VLWARANADARTIVTMNKGDFTRLAKNSIFHPGLLIIPSGGSRIKQLEYVMTVVGWAMTLNYPASAFANRCIEVSVTLDLSIEDMTLTAGADIYQRFLN
jgi:hypothetical protein